jgi:hypothetical protein
MAITGMVLGIVGFIVAFIPCLWWGGLLLGILGAIFSGIGLAQANKAGAGKGMAVAGLVLSILAIIWAPLWVYLFVSWFFGTTKDAAEKLKEELERQRKKSELPRPAIVAKAEPQSRANDWALPS